MLTSSLSFLTLRYNTRIGVKLTKNRRPSISVPWTANHVYITCSRRRSTKRMYCKTQTFTTYYFWENAT